jgi:uncharacterized protein (DUF3084 family)
MTSKMLKLSLAAALALGAAPALADTGTETTRQQGQMDQQEHRVDERQQAVEQREEQLERKEERAENMQVEQVKLNQLSRNEIRDLQQALKDRGFYEGEIDGVVGPLTYGALGAFQKEEGGKVTARLDLQTARALELDFGEIQPVRGGGPEERQLDEDETDDVESIEDDLEGPGDRVIDEMRDKTNTNVPEEQR